MANSEPTIHKTQEQVLDDSHHLQLSLPGDTGFGLPMHFYDGFWCLDKCLDGVITFKNNFQAHDTDVILASLPKTGTTWLKSLIFIISNRKKISTHFSSEHPFHTKNPHELIPNFEFRIYRKNNDGEYFDVSQIPSPRFFGTHVPYLALANSIKTSKCRIVYVCRNPLDTFVSSWLFYPNNKSQINEGIEQNMELLEECLSKYCKGILPFGPYEDHLSGYWKESVQNPDKVLFLEYEGLKKDPKTHLKRLAEFVNCPFSEEEEKGLVIDEIIELCSLDNMKEMEINKSGNFGFQIEHNALLRKGEVGDWINYLTPSMANRLNDTIQEKLKKIDFSFKYYQANL